MKPKTLFSQQISSFCNGSPSSIQASVPRTIAIRPFSSTSTRAETVICRPGEFRPLTTKDLITSRIATASSIPSAQHASFNAALAKLSKRDDTSFGWDRSLAHKLKRGEVVRFKDNDEKLRAVALAQEFADNAALKASVRKGKTLQPHKIEFSSPDDKYRAQLVDTTMRGIYKVSQNQSSDHVARNLSMNDSYTTKPGKGFLAALRRLVPT